MSSLEAWPTTRPCNDAEWRTFSQFVKDKFLDMKAENQNLTTALCSHHEQQLNATKRLHAVQIEQAEQDIEKLKEVHQRELESVREIYVSRNKLGDYVLAEMDLHDLLKDPNSDVRLHAQRHEEVAMRLKEAVNQIYNLARRQEKEAIVKEEIGSATANKKYDFFAGDAYADFSEDNF